MTVLHSHSADRREIDEVCEQFETAWRSGAAMTVEEMLSKAPTSLSLAQLTQELIAIEVELRSEQGTRPSADEYLARFPQWSGWIDLGNRSQIPAADSSAPPSQKKQRDDNDVSPETDIPGFRIIKEIGRGGMGTVYKAVDLRLGRLVALKVIRTSDGPSSFDGQRFQREATTIAQLHHPGIVQIFGVDEYAGHSYLVLELIEGKSLQDLLLESKRDPDWVAMLIARLARVVHYAHRRGIVHRDLKPANILLTSADNGGLLTDSDDDSETHACPVPVITDFGLAKQLFADETISGNGALFGTPSYMPPEQAQGRSFEATPASDVYSLGAVFYELLTGQPPFAGGTHLETIRMVCRAKPAPVRELVPDTPVQLERICMRCLEKDPDDRYPSAAALADDLRAYLTAGNLSERTQTTPLARVRTYALTAITVAAIVLTGLIGYALGAAH